MATPVPILMMARELNLGGTERQLTEMAKVLDRSRFAPHVGCFRPAGLRADELRAAGVPIVQFHVPSMASVKGAFEIARYVRDQGIRLVHTFDTPANVYGVPAARMAGTAVVVSSQRVDRSLWPGAVRHALRITDRLVDGVVVNCEYLRRQLRDEEKVPDGLIHLCYNGIDTGVFHARRGERPAALRGASLVIGAVSALRPEKDLATLLEAFARVRNCVPGVQLAIVGSGPCLADLEERAGTLEIMPQCVFEPATPHVAEWLRAIDIFVLPSLSEALSNALMEAMSCGCCGVASRVGGNPELITHGETGMLFEARDVAGLAETLRSLLQDSALRSALAARAEGKIQQQFTLAAAARRMGKIYAALLPEH
ncbi:MAG TPA: glycosyltransferase [Bryobacteraceae bacterium]|nr:glycosyltransferase [Bryobacteraceae bacterium]